MSEISRANDIFIEDYLGYEELRIPMFQREYVWDSEEIEEFWNDLAEEEVRFLGSIILKDQNYDFNKRSGYLEIVDGQQRTVSILLLLKTISRKLMILARARRNDYEQNAARQAEDIDRLISKRDRNDLTRVLNYKLVLPSEGDNIAFKNVLDGNSAENKKEHKNFFNAQEKLESLLSSYLGNYRGTKKQIQALVALKNTILGIKIIQVLVPSDEDAYMIFEAVNDRGADLGAAELLKNHLFARMPRSQQPLIHEEWQKIRKSLSQINKRSLDLTSFLRYYWIGKYEHLSKKGLFKGIKKKMATQTAGGPLTPETILGEIGEFRGTLEKIFLYGLDDWKMMFDGAQQAQDKRKVLRRAIEWFSYKRNLEYFPKSVQYLPIHTALIGNLNKIEFTERPFIDLLRAVEKINFLYSYVMQGQTNKIDKMLSGIGRDILGEIVSGNKESTRKKVQEGVSKIEKFLKQNIKRQDVYDFVASLNYNKATDKAIIYFILINLEYVEGGYDRPLTKEGLTLEHVYPKSIEQKGVVPGWLPMSVDDYKTLGHGIGNLTLLPPSGPQANGAAGEEEYKTKRDNFLLPSTYALNAYFSGISEWDKGQIEKRLTKLQEDVWSRWGS